MIDDEWSMGIELMIDEDVCTRIRPAMVTYYLSDRE